MLTVEQGPGPSRKHSSSMGQGCLLLVPVLDVEEEEGAGHDHAEDGEGRQDAVQRKGDLSQLFQDDGLVLGWLRPCKVKEKLSDPSAVIFQVLSASVSFVSGQTQHLYPTPGPSTHWVRGCHDCPACPAGA